MEQKDREPARTEQQPKEPLLSRSAMIIGGVVAAATLAIMAVILWPRLVPAKEAKAAGTEANEIDRIAAVELGRVEVCMPNDTMQQSYTRVAVLIHLVVNIEDAPKLAEEVGRLKPILMESSRQCFLDVDSRDLLAERTAGVKNAIKTRLNQRLGEEIVKEVVFAEYRAM